MRTTTRTTRPAVRPPGGRARALRVGLVTATALALTGCGDAPGNGAPATTTTAASPAAHPWPDPDLTVVTTPRGTGTPVTEWDEEVAAVLAEQDDQDHQRLLEVLQHQDDVSALFDEVRSRYPERSSSSSQATYEGDPAWIALTGEVPPDLVPLAEELPVPVELRGGAAMSEAERGAVQEAGLDAFEAALHPSGGWTGGLDAASARFSISYVAQGSGPAGEGTEEAVADAARAALGRDVAVTVDLWPDDRDPALTEPAVWLLRAGTTADPVATSVEVLVEEQGCTSGEGAAGNIAEPVVEVTDAEVRIAVSTYIRQGPQTCPGAPLAPLVVDLGQPLGGRALVDAHGTVDDDVLPPERRHRDVVAPPAAAPSR